MAVIRSHLPRIRTRDNDASVSAQPFTAHPPHTHTLLHTTPPHSTLPAVYYPQLLGRTVLMHPPRFFLAVFGMFRSFMSAKARVLSYTIRHIAHAAQLSHEPLLSER